MTYIIAEIAQAHDGSIGIVHSLIDAISRTGVNAVKFQMHFADAESSQYETFRVNFSYEDVTRYDYWKRTEFTFSQWAEIKNHCESVGCDFLCTPFSIYAIELLEKLHVDRYKIGSADIDNLLLIDKIISTKKPVIFSTGLSELEKIDNLVNRLKENNLKYQIMQCTSRYPNPPEFWCLEMIKVLKDRYNAPVGYSDHSGTIYSGISAVAFGAELLEVHTTFDKNMFGPDSSSSLDINDLTNLVNGIRLLDIACKSEFNSKKTITTDDKILLETFSRSLSIRRDMHKGEVLKFDDLETKKPGKKGIDVKDYPLVIGKVLNKNLKKNSFLKIDDLNKNED
jgi:N,N'-diacetyllegionaminate synthase